MRSNEDRKSIFNILKIKEILNKPKKYHRKIEIDPFEIFKKVAEKSTKFKINYDNDIHLEYLNRRKELLSSLESFCILQNSDQETFFQAVYYLEKIIFEKKLTNLIEKIAGSDKFNYANNNETNFLEKFRKNEFNYNESNFSHNASNKAIFSNVIEFDYLFVSLAIGCFNLSNKYIEKIPRIFDENKIKEVNLKYEFTNKDLHESELICLELLDYNLNDLCSFSILKLILQNGIILQSENFSGYKFDSHIENLYDNILVMNSMFLVDKRFMDFNALEVALSIITFYTELFKLYSWKNKILSFYTKKFNINICACLFIIKSLYSIDQSYFNELSKNDSNEYNNNNNATSNTEYNSHINKEVQNQIIKKEKVNENIDYEYYQKITDSLNQQLNLDNLNYKHNQITPIYYNNNQNFNKNIINFQLNHQLKEINNKGLKDSRTCQNVAFNYFYQNSNSLIHANADIGRNYNSNNIIAKKINLVNSKNFREDANSNNQINQIYNQNNSFNNLFSYSNYFFNNNIRINQQEENMIPKSFNETFNENFDQNINSRVSNYYNFQNITNSSYNNANANSALNINFPYNNIDNFNYSIKHDNINNNNYNNLRLEKEDLRFNKNFINKDLATEVVTIKNSKESSISNSLVNSIKQAYKDSSDSTKIEESPANKTTDSIYCLKENSDSRMLNFFNSVNRKLLESEALFQSGKKSK